MILAAIEAGGTKLNCAVGTGPGQGTIARASLTTGDDPRALLDRVTAWLGAQARNHGPIRALGVASFGPVDLDPTSPTYGFITSTPKPGFRDTDLLGALRRALGDVPVGFDTDVNGAALGEHRWGAAIGLTDFIYITMGTGIGAGGMSGGKLLHGLSHPEAGHIMLPRGDDSFAGVCPFHGACWEGLCSGPAIWARTGVPAEALPEDHPAWVITAHYTALAISALTLVLSPQRVIVGGSVRNAGKLGERGFFALVRRDLAQVLNGYPAHPAFERLDAYLVPPLLGDEAGIAGAFALAEGALISP